MTLTRLLSGTHYQLLTRAYVTASSMQQVKQHSLETWTAGDGTIVTIRPISADDLALEKEFAEGLSANTVYQRLMSVRRPSLEELRRLTDLDPEREFALIATTPVQGRERQIGVARYVKDVTPGEAEFAIVLSDDWQRRGLGTRLLGSLLAAAKADGVQRLVGTTMSDNDGMLKLGRRLGFRLDQRAWHGIDHEHDCGPFGGRPLTDLRGWASPWVVELT